MVLQSCVEVINCKKKNQIKRFSDVTANWSKTCSPQGENLAVNSDIHSTVESEDSDIFFSFPQNSWKVQQETAQTTVGLK